jgi:hypothetical protein
MIARWHGADTGLMLRGVVVAPAVDGAWEPPGVVPTSVAAEGIRGTQPLLHRPDEKPFQTGGTTSDGGCRHIPSGQERDDIVQTDLVKWPGQVLCGQGQVRPIGTDRVGAGLQGQRSEKMIAIVGNVHTISSFLAFPLWHTRLPIWTGLACRSKYQRLGGGKPADHQIRTTWGECAEIGNSRTIR